MADDYVVLNPGAGGDVMDEESIIYGTAPTTRKRSRIVVAGSAQAEVARIMNTAPTGTEYALAVRQVGNITAGTIPGQQVGLGRFFLSSTGRVTLTAAGNFRAIVQNPSGSGKTINLARLSAFATGTGYATILLNPTTGVPATTARPITNAVLGGGFPSIAILRADTDLTTAMSGGTDTGLVFGIPGGARTTIDLPPLVLSAGQTMGLNVPFAGAADVTMSVYWWES